MNKQRLRSLVNKVWQMLKQPRVIILLLSLLLLAKFISYGRLAYGDIPLFDVDSSTVNFLYAWGPEQLGTSVRQSLNTARDVVLQFISVSDYVYYFLKYILPVLLIPLVYFWILQRFGIRNRIVLVIGSLFPLFTPVVFGDFLNGQTFWVYLTVPFVYYFAIKIYCLGRFEFKNYLLLGIFLFLSFGALAPVILPLALIFAVIVTTGFFLNFRKLSPGLVGSYIMSGIVVGITFILLAAPYLFVASSGQSSFTPTSLLGDYYHNYVDTTFANVFRLAGNNGNGQTTLDYNLPTITNAAGYFILILTLAGLFLLNKNSAVNFKRVVLCLLVPLLAIIGFLNIMATQQDLGAQIFQSQWIVSTIRNPSKLYLLALPFLAWLLALALQNYMYFYKSVKLRAATIFVTVGLIAIYGWPALRGDLGLLFQREDKLVTYQPDETDQQIIRQVPMGSRSLMMPATHRDELNYQNINPGFNVLRLEGGVPATASFVRQMNRALNNQDEHFFNYLAASGIEDVFVKKSIDAYQTAPFGLFPVDLLPSQARSFLSEGLQLKQNASQYWRFHNQHADPLVYSPERIVDIGGSDDLRAKAPFLGNRTAVLDDEKSRNKFGEYATQYQAKNNLHENERITLGKALLHDNRVVLANIYAVHENDKRFLILEILNPLTQAVETTLKQEVSDSASIFTLGEDRYTFSEQKKTVTIRAGSQELIPASLQEVDIRSSDPSFEGGIPKSGDASINSPGKADFQSSAEKDATDGAQSLGLSSKNHDAYVERDFQASSEAQTYLLKFDYKNLTGSAPSFVLLHDGEPLMSGSGSLAQNGDWQSSSSYFDFKSSAGQATLKFFLYTKPNGSKESKNLFDNIRLYAVNKEQGGTVDIPDYQSSYGLDNYQQNETLTYSPGNILDDGSFEDPGLWGGVQDATAGAKGEPRIRAEQSSDRVDGKKSLLLASNNHTAYVTKRAARFEANKVYRLSFRYKHISGRNPSFAVWQGGSGFAQPSQELKGEPGVWNYFETYFVPATGTESLAVYLYSHSAGQATVNLFDDVKLEQTSLVSTYLEKKTDPAMSPNNLLTSYERVNPTEIKVTMKRGKGMLIFNESFQKGWHAYVVPRGFTEDLAYKLMLKVPEEEIGEHVTVNGFANGWWIDSSQYKSLAGSHGDYQLVLLYMPQKSMYLGFIISGATAVALTGYLLYTKRRDILNKSGLPGRNKG